MSLGDSSIIALYRRLIIAVTCLARVWEIPVVSEDFEKISFRFDAMASQKMKTCRQHLLVKLQVTRGSVPEGLQLQYIEPTAIETEGNVSA
jgi:hypothetical protein